MPIQYSRRTIIAATQVLKSLGHSGLPNLALELDFPDGAVDGATLKLRSTSLAQYLLGKSVQPVIAGAPEEIVRRAIAQVERYGSTLPNVTEEECTAFREALAEDAKPPPLSPMNEAIRAAMSGAKQATIASPEPIGATKSVPLSQPEGGSRSSSDTRRVFVVHGRDETLRESVVNVLHKAKCKPIVLSEQVSGGQTIIEKIEKHGDVEFAVVLLSPDDEGALKGEALRDRARQNVLLELGYFFGRLKRHKLAVLMKGDVEFPSDFAGVVWRDVDQGGGWKLWLAKEIHAAGISIDWNDFHS